MNVRRHKPHTHSTVPGTACEAPALRHDHVAPLAAPSELSLPEDGPLYPDTLAHNAPASRHGHTVALQLYVGTDKVSTQRRGRLRKKELPPQAHADAARSAGPPPVARPPATACKHWEFRDYAFAQGRILLAQRRLDRVTAKELGESFKKIHPTAPSTVGSYLNMREFWQAVRANNITQLLMKRQGGGKGRKEHTSRPDQGWPNVTHRCASRGRAGRPVLSSVTGPEACSPGEGGGGHTVSYPSRWTGAEG
jgi:hypothetical protein